MGKGGNRCGIGVVVGGHINCLERGDRTLFGRCDSFLELTHFCSQSWLITYCGRCSSEKCGDFGAGLGKSKDVIDKKKDILIHFISKVFGDGKGCEGYSKPCTRWLVHLAEDHCKFVQNTSFVHFPIQIISLSCPFTDTGKNRIATVFFGYIIDKFLNNDGFAYSGTTENSYFPSFYKRSHK